MSKTQWIKFSGWAFILGSFSFATILSGSDLIAFPGSVISTILLGIGLFGLRARYGEHAGGFGRSILRVGVIATILPYIGLACMAVLPNGGQLVDKGGWILMFGGPTVALFALILFGLASLANKPIAHLNWLQVFAGIWYPFYYFFIAGYIFTHHGVYPGQYQIAFNIMHLIQFIALCAFGFTLVTNSSQEMATA